MAEGEIQDPAFKELNLDLTVVRQIVSAYRLAELTTGHNTLPRIGVGKFKRRAAVRYSAADFKAKFEVFEGDVSGRIYGVFGDVDIKWISANAPSPIGGYFAAISEKDALNSPITPTLMLEEFWAVFVVPEKIDYKVEKRGLMTGSLLMYEIPPTWPDGLARVFSGAPNTGLGGSGSEFEIVSDFVKKLGAVGSDPAAAGEICDRLLSSLRAEMNKNVAEILFYGAISTSSSVSEPIYWETFMAALRTGSLSKVSGARIFLALVSSSKLSQDRRVQLVNFLRPSELVGNEGSYDYSKFTPEVRQVVRMLSFFSRSAY